MVRRWSDTMLVWWQHYGTAYCKVRGSNLHRIAVISLRKYDNGSRVFLFLLGRKRRSARRSANAASYALYRGGLPVDDDRQTMAVIVTFRTSNKNWLERQAGVYRSIRKRNTLYIIIRHEPLRSKLPLGDI